MRRYWQYCLQGLRALAKFVGGLAALYFIFSVFHLIMNPEYDNLLGDEGWEYPVYLIGFFSFTYGAFWVGKNATKEKAREEALKEVSQYYNLNKLIQDHDREVKILMEIIDELKNKLAGQTQKSN